jgi:hypothetical protein
MRAALLSYVGLLRQRAGLAPYLLSVPPSERLHVQGLWDIPWQGFRTVAGMVGVPEWSA